MRERDLVLGLLRQIMEATDRIQTRFEPIRTADDFVASEVGREKLDAICMPLSSIGENLKRIDKITKGDLLSRYPSVDWRGAKATRDFIAHHYFDVDHEMIFDICKHLIPSITQTVQKMISDLAN